MLLTKEENPRSKCWKVRVPYKFKEVMEKDELYHAGWTHRKFFGARNSNSKQKQPRLDDPIEQDIAEQVAASGSAGPVVQDGAATAMDQGIPNQTSPGAGEDNGSVTSE